MGVQFRKLDEQKYFLANEYISWVLSQDGTKAIQFLNDQISQFSNLNLIKLANFSKSFNQKNTKLFSINCCSISLAPNLETIAVGDFLGKVRIISNESKEKTFKVGCQVKIMHYHNFLPNFLIIANSLGQIFIVSTFFKQKFFEKSLSHSQETYSDISNVYQS